MGVDRQPTAARVLVVDDEPDILELLELALLRMGLQVEHATNVREALQQLDSKPYNLCLTDMRLPDGDGLEVYGTSLRIMRMCRSRDNRTWQYGKCGFRAQGWGFRLPVQASPLEQLRALVKAALKLPQQSVVVREGVRMLLGRSPAMEKVRDLIETRCAQPGAGAYQRRIGSGKELAARLIVEKSARRDQPFVAVNCGAIPENLMESEFFATAKCLHRCGEGSRWFFPSGQWRHPLSTSGRPASVHAGEIAARHSGEKVRKGRCDAGRSGGCTHYQRYAIMR